MNKNHRIQEKNSIPKEQKQQTKQRNATIQTTNDNTCVLFDSFSFPHDGLVCLFVQNRISMEIP